MKIVIKGEELELKYSFRALIIYENIMQKSFDPKGISEVITFFYCIILGSKKDIQFTYDEFLEWLDENPAALGEFSQWILKVVEKNNELMMKNVSNEDKKKLAKAKKSEKNF